MPSGRGQWLAWSAAAGWLAVAACRTAAEPPKLAGETPRTAQRFAEAAAFEKNERWSDAVELYLRLLDEAGDDLVPADGDGRHLLPARGMVHRRVASRPDLLARYRDRVEPRAKRLLEQGQSDRDPQPLEQLVDQFFCTRSAEPALHRLGDLACERGEFDVARRYWHLLEPATSGDLAYPDPVGGPALARAKQILARLLAGERAEAATSLAEFRKAHTDSTGRLAGRNGNFAATLQQLLDRADAVRVPTAIGVAPAPTTFAGDAGRNGLLPRLLPPFSPERRYPPIVLSGSADRQRAAWRVPVRAASLPFHPVIARGQVFVADAGRVTAYDLATGRLSGRFEHLKSEETSATGRVPESGGGFTLTVDGDRVYARLGPPKLRPRRGEPGSVLVCLQWRPAEASPADRLKPRWTLRPVQPTPDSVAAWEGPPIVRDGRLYAAVTRLDGPRAVTAVVCYEADDPAAGPIWQKDLFEAAADTTDRTRPLLLASAGRHVALCSHAGVIVAMEAATGRRAWAFRYPSRQALVRGTTGLRDAAPCVMAGGRLYAAPADADRVYCLDATTGAPVWTSDPLDVAHLLGVAGGRVVCALGGFHAGLCALDCGTGARLPNWGYRVAGTEALAPFGRGLLCGDRVYWPTRSAGLKELRWDGTTGYPPTAFLDLPGGNLAYGDGCLAVATADGLHVLVGDTPDAGEPGRRVGQASPDEDGLSRDRRHALLLWRAAALRLGGRPADDVRSAFDAAARSEFAPEQRILAIVRRTEFERAGGDPTTIPKVARAVVNSPDLAAVSVRDADGRVWFARKWVADMTGETGGEVDRPTIPAGRHQDGRPTLRFPLRPSWHLTLDQGREWALLPAGGTDFDCVFVAGRGWLACRDAQYGADRWRRDLAFTPLWIGAAEGAVIAAGDGGAAKLSATDGRLEWQFRLPDVAPCFDRPGWLDPHAVATAGRLTGFQWAGGRLIARLGSRSLLALVGTTGEPLWQRNAPFSTNFHPVYFADDRWVVTQCANGRWDVYNAATGEVVRTGSAPLDPWPNPPVTLDDRRLLVVEDGRVVALDRSSWIPAWARDLPHWPNLTGAPPQTRVVNGVLLVGVPRNDCFEIERLDPTNGRPLGEPLVVGREPVNLAAVECDGGRLHVVADGELGTFDSHDGRVVCRRTVGPGSGWRIERGVGGLLLWTVPAAWPFEPPSAGQVVATSIAAEGQVSSSLPFGPGTLKSVRVIGNEVVVVSDGAVRGFRGANHEVK